MDIDTIMQVLDVLHLNYRIEHFNDYSRLVIASNSELNDTEVIFDCIDKEIDEIDILDPTEKETIYVVKEDNHGEIGYAKTLKGIAEILVNGGWITPQTTIYDGEKEHPITNYINEVTVESIQKALEEENEMFTDWIYVTREELHK